MNLTRENLKAALFITEKISHTFPRQDARFASGSIEINFTPMLNKLIAEKVDKLFKNHNPNREFRFLIQPGCSTDEIPLHISNYTEATFLITAFALGDDPIFKPLPIKLKENELGQLIQDGDGDAD